MKRVIYLILGSGLLLFGCGDEKQKTRARAMPVPEVLVRMPVQKEVTYTYEYPAYLKAVQTVNLVARVSGFLEQIGYTAGQTVKAGTTLFTIEPQTYRDRLDVAKAQMNSAEAQLAYAKAQYEKMKEAMTSQAVSEIDFIQAESGYHSAIAAQQTARAQLRSARTNLDYCYIKAPFDGRVSRNLIDTKNFVDGAMQPVTLATMYRDKLMYAYFNMAYAEFQNLPPVGNSRVKGNTTMPVSISDATNPTQQWSGQLDYTSPNVDLQTGTVDVRASVDNPQEILLSGMYVKIIVPYKQVPNALMIPEASIGTNQAGRYVYLVDKNNEIILKTVKVGVLEPDGMREVVSGITPTDRYVVEALISVHPGMKVKPVN